MRRCWRPTPSESSLAGCWLAAGWGVGLLGGKGCLRGGASAAGDSSIQQLLAHWMSGAIRPPSQP